MEIDMSPDPVVPMEVDLEEVTLDHSSCGEASSSVPTTPIVERRKKTEFERG
jgi:hypothetical protein